MFTLTIKTDNAAFEDTPALEVAAILKDLSDAMGNGSIEPPDTGKVRDSNGNTVGEWKLTD